MTRASIPSYRPQAKIRCVWRAYAAAISCRNGTPAGVGTISRVCGEPPLASASSASPQGPGAMTIPGPPPKGVSSTVRWVSCAHVRRSCTANSTMPRSAALPSSETRSGPKYSGKIVMMSMRTPSRPQIQQARRGVDHHPATGHVHVDRDRGHERDQYLATALRAGRWLDHQQILAMMAHVGDDADRLPGRGHHGEPDQLVIVELVRLLRGADMIGVHRKPDAAQQLGPGPVGDAGEGDQQP